MKLNSPFCVKNIVLVALGLFYVGIIGSNLLGNVFEGYEGGNKKEGAEDGDKEEGLEGGNKKEGAEDGDKEEGLEDGTEDEKKSSKKED
jgi:hypothetical protein